MARKERLKLVISVAALADQGAIWEYNAQKYGPKHADDYLTFLDEQLLTLLSYPRRGVVVSARPGYRRLLMAKRSGGHGHLAFYRITAEAIEVVRILHTAQDWTKILA